MQNDTLARLAITELLAYLLTLLDAEVIVADDFMPTEPVYRVLGDE